MGWLLGLVLFFSWYVAAVVAAGFGHANWVGHVLWVQTRFWPVVVVHFPWATAPWQLASIHALCLAAAQGLVVVSQRVEKDFYAVIDLAREIYLVVLPPSDEWAFEVRFKVLFLVLVASAMVLVSVEGLFENLLYTRLCIDYSSAHALILQCQVEFFLIRFHALDLFVRWILALSEPCHEAHWSFVRIIFLSSINVETLDLVLSSDNSVTARFYCPGFRTGRGFLKVLSDEFVSFGVHDFVDEQLVGDFELIFFCDVR